MTDQKNPFIFGAAVGSGLTALAVDRAGADFLLVLNAGRLRMRGASSLASYLPLRPANEWVFEIAEEEILHRCVSPVLAGLNVRDPAIDPIEIVEKANSIGFAGVCNFPSAAMLEGQLRQLMEAEGIGFGKECELIRAASERGMKTLAYVCTNREARMMVEAGADRICVVVGFTGGRTGVSTSLTLEGAADLANQVLEGIPANIATLIEGGPITSPEDALTVTRLSRVNGYIAGSTIDRLPLEQAIEEVARSYKVIAKMGRGNKDDVAQPSAFIGSSHAMQTLRKLVADIAPSDMPVLITGETGTGKSLLAADIHKQHYAEKRDPVVVDCTSLSRDVGPVQLMGQVAGLNRRDVPLTRGALETAHGNGIILEEVSALSAELQGLILRFAETGYVQRIGALDGRTVNVRLLSTSNQNIEDLVEVNEFRRDLYHRINAIQIAVPPLRERRDDIAELAAFFAHNLTRNEDIQFTNAALRVLLEYDWPGNVRELKNAIRRILTLNSSGRVTARDVNFLTLTQIPEQEMPAHPERPIEPIGEREWIAAALKQHNYRKGATAQYLGIAPRTLYNKMKKFQLD
ncbi:phosphoenolpyruvate hydrolase family protein [Shimia sagamensis]|uniref:DNA-binding transcriptional response regulator, NtrC family, contains REC, AAA-type ATPase, and a Fis-type DNA-binding domains n=1 Tax=Shimia sagamensis TaxID=1566352 RepID=A0ABY1PK97_9RHOB|nr:phosphoenolpyruvate hydrolase family protein [Shimia sagamensis]SMP35439.1 DNA-binding transcriptional response regulator, NtrC family, contains REC, AAA-type ATPase, and a Fis-type DNA-binding domains [Shimia sagamensis]